MFFSALGAVTAGWSASLVDMRPSSFEGCYLLQFFHTVRIEMWAWGMVQLPNTPKKHHLPVGKSSCWYMPVFLCFMMFHDFLSLSKGVSFGLLGDATKSYPWRIWSWRSGCYQRLISRMLVTVRNNILTKMHEHVTWLAKFCIETFLENWRWRFDHVKFHSVVCNSLSNMLERTLFQSCGSLSNYNRFEKIRNKRCVDVTVGKLRNHVGPEIGDNQILESHWSQNFTHAQRCLSCLKFDLMSCFFVKSDPCGWCWTTPPGSWWKRSTYVQVLFYSVRNTFTNINMNQYKANTKNMKVLIQKKHRDIGMKIVEDLGFRFLKQNISHERLPYTENVPFSQWVLLWTNTHFSI